MPSVCEVEQTEQKTAAQEEKTAIDSLLAERSAKQQEVYWYQDKHYRLSV